MDVLVPRSCLGHFDVLVDIEGEPMVILGASCFHHKQEKLYLYRSKYGHWCIGGYRTEICNRPGVAGAVLETAL